MTELDRITQIVGEMAEMYGRRMSQPALLRWAHLWEPYDADRLEKALALLGRESKWMPTIAQLRAAVSHMYPTQLTQDVANEWARRYNGLGGVPNQEQIDEMLVSWGKPRGLILRSWLLCK